MAKECTALSTEEQIRNLTREIKDLRQENENIWRELDEDWFLSNNIFKRSVMVFIYQIVAGVIIGVPLGFIVYILSFLVY